MTDIITSPSPKQTFLDNMRPAHLLLHVYRLLDSQNNILTEGELVESLRLLANCSSDEDLMVVCNEIFLGLVRERAQVPRSTLRHATLAHLLRQAVVASCTALETYLPAMMHAHLPTVIRVKGRDFVPYGNTSVGNWTQTMTFKLDEVMRILDDENAPEYIASKILRFSSFRYLGSDKGVEIVGLFLGVQKPWDAIASRLNRDAKELRRTLRDTVNRRNDIVHRADRSRDDPGGPQQEIAYAWTQQAVDTVNHVCLALDERVMVQLEQMNALVDA